MTTIFNGRYTAHSDEPFVVFLIGMRINRLREVRKWLPVTQAMPRMLQSLYANPALGFLGGHTFLQWRGTAMIQYWRSCADLERFARNPSEAHLEAWRRFNQAVGGDGSVGIWHEAYSIQPGQFESVYGNMPLFGLAAATRHVPAVGARRTARMRLQHNGAGASNGSAIRVAEPAHGKPADTPRVAQ